MTKNCDCYRTESKKEFKCYTIDGKPIVHNVTVGVCWGTKEIDECSCGGDKSKCDFYPEVREKAKSCEDGFLIAYENCSPDLATLTVAKKENDQFKIVNTIRGDIASELYQCLIGKAESFVDVVEVVNAHWEVYDDNEDGYSHHRCSNCKEDAIFTYEYEDMYDENYDGEWCYVGNVCVGIDEHLTKFCPQCGAKMNA